jgi:hypothetical protein
MRVPLEDVAFAALPEFIGTLLIATRKSPDEGERTVLGFIDLVNQSPRPTGEVVSDAIDCQLLTPCTCRWYSRWMKVGACGSNNCCRSGVIAKKLPTTVPVQLAEPQWQGQESPSKALSR